MSRVSNPTRQLRQALYGRPSSYTGILKASSLARRHLASSAPLSSPPSTSTSSPSPSPLAPSSRLAQNYPRLVQLSARTGVPLPSLGISFLILHELTAFLPLIVFFYLFQAIGVGVGLLGWIRGTAGVSDSKADPTRRNGPEGTGGAGADMEHEVGGWKGVVRGWYEEGEKRVEKVGKKYGILGYDKVDRINTTSAPTSQVTSELEGPGSGGKEMVKSATGSKAAEAVANAISAYVVVKALLPLRIAASVGLAPAFARFALNPVHRVYRRFRGASST